MKKSKSHPILEVDVWRAYAAVKRKGGGAGVDGKSLEVFASKQGKEIYKIWNRMASGSYFPPPVKQVIIPKSDGKTRKLGIPTVGDRIAQMVVKQHLEPKLDPLFHKWSFGYRPRRGAKMALENMQHNCWDYPWLIDLDIKGFFDHLDHEKLMIALRKHTQEKWVLLYVERWLKAPIQLPDGSSESRDEGTPQGGVISPLLANLYLHYAFDKWMDINYPECPFERYADDIVVHCWRKKEAFDLLGTIRNRMLECNLELHPHKTKIVYCKDDKRKGAYPEIEATFLGHTFRPRCSRDGKGKLFTNYRGAMSKAAKKEMSSKLRALRIEHRTRLSIEELAQLVNPILRGYLNYFGNPWRAGMQTILRVLARRLMEWVRNKHKKLRRNQGKAWAMLRRIHRSNPKLFAHWEAGIKP